MATESAAPVAPATAEDNGKKRKKLPEVAKVFDTKAKLDAGQKEARDKGHTYDTRKFKVTVNGKSMFVLGYSPANAAGQVIEELGIAVEELDPSERAAFQMKPETFVSKLSDEDRKAVLALLTAKPAKK